MSFIERLDSPLSVLVALLWLAAFYTIFAKLEIYPFLMMIMMIMIVMMISGGQSTQIKYLSKRTDTYKKILLQ